MSLYAIGDLHLSLGGNKPMDVFPGWADYVSRLEDNWRGCISADDTVVLAGDTSWAMGLEQTKVDFAFIHSLPGRKILLKGNHDYWWATLAKMNGYLAEEGFTSLSFLYNNCYAVGDVVICGSRGWMNEPNAPHDAKVMAREAGRLRLSLEAASREHPTLRKLVFLHYPLVYQDSAYEEMTGLLREYQIEQCFYGHLHGQSIYSAVQRTMNGVDYKLISADALRFKPLKIRDL